MNLKFVRIGLALNCLLISLCLICFLQLLLVATIKRVTPHFFRKINESLANFWWGLCVFFAKKTFKIKFKISGDNPPPLENVFLIANHQASSDILAIFYLAFLKKRLGQLKWFVKYSLKFVPFLGWGLISLECVFLKRNWALDKKNIQKTYSHLKEKSRNFWLICFAEGTRFSESKLKKIKLRSTTATCHDFKHVLPPKTKGSVTSIIELRNNLTAIYNVTIGFKDKVPTLLELVSGKVKEIHMHVQRTGIEEIPNETRELESFILNSFITKDKLLEHFKEYGNFENVLQT